MISPLAGSSAGEHSRIILQDFETLHHLVRLEYVMKNYLRQASFSLLALLIATGCQGQNATSSPTPKASRTTAPQICCGGQGGDPDKNPDQAVAGILSKNFGVLDQGEILVETFSLTNDGKNATTLTADPTFSYPCCVEVELSDKTLQPGQSAEVKLTFDSSLRPGPIDIFVDLPFDSESVSKKLHLGGTVKKEFVVHPTGLKFEKPESIEFRVSGDGLFKTFKVLGFENEIPGLKIEEKSRTDKDVVYQATWTKEAKGSEIQPVYLLTDHPRVKRFPILIAPPGVDVGH